ncbi:MAG: hypothetical protein LKF58_02135 [Bacilli bacterium]|jgi:hypothetical protein|nr:hypothetical protein [Bacilli bacterium]MCH4210566.1 hypothetical protein [Bacilli bacterium]MCH4277412.1 hypothetical protein [Bacilli bacterium]
MKNKKYLLLLVLPLALLTSCSESSFVVAGRYTSNEFKDNYYTIHEFTDSDLTKEKKSADIYYPSFSEGIGGDDSSYGGIDRKGAKSLFPSIFNYTDPTTGESSTLETASIKDWTPANEGDDSSFIGKSFGRTKCLGRTDPAFKYGVTSKLYNGQMYCRGYHNAALFQVGSDGFSTIFPKTLETGDYFLMSFRGGSTAGDGRNTYVDLNLRFIYEADGGYEYVSIKANDVHETTDVSGESDIFFAFSFSSIGIDPVGIKGFEMYFSGVYDPSHDESTTPTIEADNYFALMVYEVMFPDSTWR